MLKFATIACIELITAIGIGVHMNLARELLRCFSVLVKIKNVFQRLRLSTLGLKSSSFLGPGLLILPAWIDKLACHYARAQIRN